MSGLCRVYVGFWSSLCQVYVGFWSGLCRILRFGPVLFGFMSGFVRVYIDFGFISGFSQFYVGFGRAVSV